MSLLPFFALLAGERAHATLTFVTFLVSLLCTSFMTTSSVPWVWNFSYQPQADVWRQLGKTCETFCIIDHFDSILHERQNPASQLKGYHWLLRREWNIYSVKRMQSRAINPENHRNLYAKCTFKNVLRSSILEVINQSTNQSAKNQDQDWTRN